MNFSKKSIGTLLLNFHSENIAEDEYFERQVDYLVIISLKDPWIPYLRKNTKFNQTTNITNININDETNCPEELKDLDT